MIFTSHPALPHDSLIALVLDTKRGIFQDVRFEPNHTRADAGADPEREERQGVPGGPDISGAFGLICFWSRGVGASCSDQGLNHCMTSRNR